MRDLSLNEFSDSFRESLADKNIHLPAWVVRRLVKAFFMFAEKIAAHGNDRLTMYNRDITRIFPVRNVKELCAELAYGKRVLTADYLIRKKKLSREVARHIKKVSMTAEVEI